MASVALMDIFSLACVFGEKWILFYQELYPCYSKTTDYNLMMLDMIRLHIRSFTRRCSTWLSLSIAIIRALVIRYPMSVRFEMLSRPRTIIYVIGGVLCVVIPNSIGDFLSLDVSTYDKNFDCKNHLSIRFYTVDLSKLFQKSRLFRPIVKIAEALISKMIPCVLFPIATIVLIKEIRKANIRRNTLASNSASSSQTNTSYLVLAQTVTFFIAEFPLGIVFLLQYTVYCALLGAFERFFTSVLTITTATHMFICFFMSSQYRLAVRLFLRGGYPLKYNFDSKDVSRNKSLKQHNVQSIEK
ncbi:hypothetical protein CAEBREN_29567 [Caenorhabditis brenneri]|uniref:G-protein coupled receptors family 1 profile domain-containing protein n=1 Tax=Caenorhabditis brenneri TaxID=135651 RepID=G0P0G1_CAEBE|nr:hypothetical protein CAEBREN_29567 [Caenorhabditis brenneri]